MLEILFFLFSATALACSLMVVLSRNPVNGAMFMILTFVSTAALFFLLEAFLLGVLQILVYAGAVMVLFLFIIMLLDVQKEKCRPISKTSVLSASVVSVVLAMGVFLLFSVGLSESNGRSELTEPSGLVGFGLPFETTAAAYGRGLMTKYLLPVQVAGFLLLSALIGVIIVSKRLDATGENSHEDVEGTAA